MPDKKMELGGDEKEKTALEQEIPVLKIRSNLDIEQKLSNQILHMRNVSFTMAVLVIVFFAYVEIRSFNLIQDEKINNQDVGWLFMLIISPILAMTAVTIALLAGVFKKDNAPDNLVDVLYKVIRMFRRNGS